MDVSLGLIDSDHVMVECLHPPPAPDIHHRDKLIMMITLAMITLAMITLAMITLAMITLCSPGCMGGLLPLICMGLGGVPIMPIMCMPPPILGGRGECCIGPMPP